MNNSLLQIRSTRLVGVAGNQLQALFCFFTATAFTYMVWNSLSILRVMWKGYRS